MGLWHFINKQIISRGVRLCVRTFPFLGAILMSGLLISFMAEKISAKKTELTLEKAGVEETGPPKTRVVTLEMVPAQMEETLNLPGVVKPWVTLDIMAQVNGTVVRKIVTQGRQVKKGDPLALIDPRDYEYGVASAKAAYEAALKAEKRLRTLFEKKFATRSQLDDAVMNLATCKAALDNAALNLAWCTIRSPMQGLVDRVHIENGKLLKPGDPVVRIIRMDKVKVAVGIPESDVTAVRQIKDVSVTIDALNRTTFPGRTHYLHKTSDTASRLYTLEVRVDNPGYKILPDMFVRVEMVKQRADRALAVPVYSLVTRNRVQGVFVEEEGRAQFREITTGLLAGGQIQVSKGLSPGDRVVVMGHRFIEQGSPVMVNQCLKKIKELSR